MPKASCAHALPDSSVQLLVVIARPMREEWPDAPRMGLCTPHHENSAQLLIALGLPSYGHPISCVPPEHVAGSHRG